jgi:HK97 family phage portal protein
MIVSSFGALQTYEAGALVPSVSMPAANVSSRAAGVWVANGDHYAQIYRTQPAVRTCVDFLARNMAQLNLHVFRRISNTDRERLRDHQLAVWLGAPNPSTTYYKLVESLMQDLGIYWRAYWLKIRRTDGELGLVRLPPASMAVEGWLMPERFLWTVPDGTVYPLDPAEVAYFSGYDPEVLDPLSPLETLSRLLAEEQAATSFRERYWENAARLEGVIERPINAPKWTKEQKESWREQWADRYANTAGQTAVLEDGMTWKSVTQSWAEAEYTAARKLTREEVAAAYHIPLPMVGILEHATFSNIREQHKNLYQDCLGPWCNHLEQEITRQVLSECRDQESVYVEFNIAEKLSGSFEEQSVALARLVGRPIMTANEGRAKLNLPAVEGDATADSLTLPLNIASTGAAAQPADPATADPNARGLTGDALGPVLEATWTRQWQRLEKLPPDLRVHAFDLDRWDRELAADLVPLYQALDPEEAARRAIGLAERINTDTLRSLVNGAVNPFVGREATYG